MVLGLVSRALEGVFRSIREPYSNLRDAWAHIWLIFCIIKKIEKHRDKHGIGTVPLPYRYRLNTCFMYHM